jgi:transposase
VDVGTHHVVDLLEDPSADALVEWLGQHPGTEVICRDRDGVYASAARRGAPSALQVADRWHLTHNLADALERFAVRALASLRKELQAEETADTTPPPELPLAATTTSLSPRRLPARNEQRHAEIRHQALDANSIGRQPRAG